MWRLWMVTIVALATAAVARADSLATSGTPSAADSFTLDSDFVDGVTQVTDFRWLPDGRMVIISKLGDVWVRPAGGGALVSAGSFAVDSSSEKGLLGVAVDPDFASTGRLFFYYSATNANGGSNANRHRVVSRTLDLQSQLAAGEILLLQKLRGPANHDGGALEIGPDHLLYVGVGDTGCNSNTEAEPPYTPTNFYGTCLSDDPTGNGGGNGKLLRIGLDGSIPPSNPLVGSGDVTACGSSCGVAISPGLVGPPRTELFAWGFRNPFRLWIDPQTGLVWVGDVGEISYEEVTIVVPGRHHGWPWREADHGHPASACTQVRVGTDGMGGAIMDQACVDPVYRCRHDSIDDPTADGGCTSITGGQIVDSCDWPDRFRGKYIFGDNSNSSMWMITPNATRDGVTGVREDFATINGGPVAIRTGLDGALYVASVGGGRIARIAPKASSPCNPPTTTTTSTSLPTGTTLPGSTCGQLAGFARAECEIEFTMSHPLCSDPIPGSMTGKMLARLGRARDRVGRAAGKTKPAAVKRLLRRADHLLGAAARLSAHGVRKGTMASACGDTITARMDVLGTLVRALMP